MSVLTPQLDTRVHGPRREDNGRAFRDAGVGDGGIPRGNAHRERDGWVEP